jgi:hypothetical protein
LKISKFKIINNSIGQKPEALRMKIYFFLLVIIGKIWSQTILENCILYENSRIIYQLDKKDNQTFILMSVANSFYGYGGIVFSNDFGENMTIISFKEGDTLKSISYNNDEYSGSFKIFPNSFVSKTIYYEKEYFYSFLSNFIYKTSTIYHKNKTGGFEKI